MRFDKIVVPVDHSLGARRSLEVAVGISSQMGGKVTALNVVRPLNASTFFPGVGIPEEQRATLALSQLKDFKTKALTFDWDFDLAVGDGRISDEILNASGDDPESLIVMGTHGRTGIHRLVLGSVAEEVLYRASCPVLTMTEEQRSDDRPRPANAETCFPVKKILVPTDFSPSSRVGVDMGAELAVGLGAEMTLLHVVDDSDRDDLELLLEEKSRVNEIFNKAEEAARKEAVKEQAELEKRDEAPRCTKHVVSGHPAKKCVEYANEGGFDLIVMGSLGRASRARSIFGSIAAQVVRLAEVPVLTIRKAKGS